MLGSKHLLADQPLLPVQVELCTSKPPTMHVHQPICAALANQQVVVKQSPAVALLGMCTAAQPALHTDQTLWKPDPTYVHFCGETA